MEYFKKSHSLHGAVLGLGFILAAAPLQATTISLNSTWQRAGFTGAGTLPVKTATSVSMDLTQRTNTTTNNIIYQDSATNFTSTAFTVGDTMTLSFDIQADTLTTVIDRGFRFSVADSSGVGVTGRIDWGAAGDKAANVGIDEAMSSTAIGNTNGSAYTADPTVGALPTTSINASSTITILMSATRVDANTIYTELSFDDLTFGQSFASNGTNTDLSDFNSIDLLGFNMRMNNSSEAVAITNINLDVSPIPEPASFLLLGLGAVGGVLRRKRR